MNNFTIPPAVAARLKIFATSLLMFAALFLLIAYAIRSASIIVQLWKGMVARFEEQAISITLEKVEQGPKVVEDEKKAA